MCHTTLALTSDTGDLRRLAFRIEIRDCTKQKNNGVSRPTQASKRLHKYFWVVQVKIERYRWESGRKLQPTVRIEVIRGNDNFVLYPSHIILIHSKKKVHDQRYFLESQQAYIILLPKKTQHRYTSLQAKLSGTELVQSLKNSNARHE